MTNITQQEILDNDALAMAVIEHLGPSALAGDKMTPLQAFELGWNAKKLSPPHSPEHAQAIAAALPQAKNGEITLEDISSLIAIAQFLQEQKYWEAQTGSKVLAQFAKKAMALLKPVAQPSAQAPAIDAVKVRELVTIDALQEVIGQHLTTLYACTRVWSAWGVGTMGEDDFVPLEETEFAGELAAAIHELLQKAGASGRGAKS